MASNGCVGSSPTRGTKCQIMEVLVEYSGAWPCLCMGKLKVTINGIIYDFPFNCLTSGGSTYFSDSYSQAHVGKGPWEINKWPDNFPKEYEAATLEVVNENIPWGCCGGCL